MATAILVPSGEKRGWKNDAGATSSAVSFPFASTRTSTRVFGMEVSGTTATTPWLLTLKYPEPLLGSPPTPSWIANGSPVTVRRFASKAAASSVSPRWKRR